MFERGLQGVGELTAERDGAPQDYFAIEPKESEAKETAMERKRQTLLARTEKLLARRDRLMDEIHRRMEPDRSDLSIKTWRLWEKIGAMNLLLRKWDRELLDLRNGEVEERRGKGTYQGSIVNKYPEAGQ
jgi:hypothetical protein